LRMGVYSSVYRYPTHKHTMVPASIKGMVEWTWKVTWRPMTQVIVMVTLATQICILNTVLGDGTHSRLEVKTKNKTTH
jgi:hypothetical protein